MDIRVNRRKFKVYAFDIESHNDIESLEKKETSMWLGSFIDEKSKVDDESCYFYNMESFIEHVENMTIEGRKSPTAKRPIKNILIYIYNLSFEWSFILPVLLNKGYTFQEEATSDKSYMTVSTRSVSSVWEVKMRYSTKGGLILFRDMSKIFGGGLRNVAKAFNLPTQKGDLDYRLNRLHNHIVTAEEKEYCFKDTKILMDILEEMHRRGDKTFFNVMSMASYSMKNLMKFGYPRTCRPYAKFREDYPFLDKEETEFLRHSVGGGICYCPTSWQFKDYSGDVYHIDAHSMHPSSAYRHMFPYGKGKHHQGKPNNYHNKINCCHVLVSYDDVKLHSVIKLIGQEFTEDAELWLWDFEIETMKKAYVNLEITYIDYYAYSFKVLPWRSYYSYCYNKRVEAKKNNDQYNILYYKLLLNSSYGKLLENPHLTQFENIIDEEGIITSVIHDKAIEDSNKLYNAKYTYIPVGSCIPAYSRCCLIELALKIGYEKVLYFDTDSIFFIKDKDTEAFMNGYFKKHCDFNRLGGWSKEEDILRCQFTAPKRYKLIEVDKKTGKHKSTFKMGGFNLNKVIEEKAIEQGIELLDEDDYKEINIGYEEVNIVSSSWQVQRAFRCKGGTLIDFQEKEISVVKKYQGIYERNVPTSSHKES